MLSNETWNALCKIGKEKYAACVGKTYRNRKTGFVGTCWTYTLCGQLCLKNGNEYQSPFADDCEEICA